MPGRKKELVPVAVGAGAVLVVLVPWLLTAPALAPAAAGLVGVTVGALTARARRHDDADLQEQRRELEQRQTDLVESVSHEFRTPLTVLRGASELLAERELITSPTGQELVGSLNRAIDRLDDLTSSVLAVSEAIADERRSSTHEAVDLREAVADAAATLRRLGGLERMRFEPEGDADTIVTSRDLLHLLLLSLGENALRSTAPGLPVEVATRRTHNGTVHLVVRDHGGTTMEPGVPLPPRPHGLHGVGLLSARRLAGRLGASLATTRTDDGGLEVTVALPQQRADDRAALERTARTTTDDAATPHEDGVGMWTSRSNPQSGLLG